jgi:phage gp36-like protein
VYASNDDLQMRLGAALYLELTDDGTGTPDEEKATEARAGAEGEIDSYLARRYAVPVDTVAHPGAAGVLRSVTLDLAEFRLRSRKPPVPDDARRKKDAAILWLQRVASGAATLPSATEPPHNPAQGVVGAVVGGPRVLTPQELADL